MRQDRLGRAPAPQSQRSAPHRRRRPCPRRCPRQIRRVSPTTAAHQAVEREQATIAQAQDAVRHFAGHAAAAEVGFREQAQAIAQAAQGALDDARQREANLRQQAQIAIDTTTREAQQRVSAIQGEAQQAITQSNQSAQARIRLVEGEALGLSEALRQANQAREQAEAERKRAEDHAQQRERDYLRLAEDMEQMRRSHEEAMARVTARFQVVSEQMAAHSRATPPQTPTRTHLSFPDMSFSPDTGQNDAVIHSTVPLVAPVPEEQETLSTPPSAQPVGESTAPQEGAAAGAPGGATVFEQPAATTPPQDTQLSSRVDEATGPSVKPWRCGGIRPTSRVTQLEQFVQFVFFFKFFTKATRRICSMSNVRLSVAC